MAQRPVPPKPVTPPANNSGSNATPKPVMPKKIYKSLNRSIVFPAKRLESEAEIDEYVEKMRESLKQLLKNCDGIHLK
jgi:predicted ribosome quality control (RQC) complex YloA/Tae2 family protein